MSETLRGRITSVSVIGGTVVYQAEARILDPKGAKGITGQFHTSVDEMIPVGFRMLFTWTNGTYIAELSEEAAMELGFDPMRHNRKWLFDHVRIHEGDPMGVHRGEPGDRLRAYVDRAAAELGVQAGFDRETENGCWRVWVDSGRGRLHGFPTPTDDPWALALAAVGLGSLDQ